MSIPWEHHHCPDCKAPCTCSHNTADDTCRHECRYKNGVAVGAEPEREVQPISAAVLKELGAL